MFRNAASISLKSISMGMKAAENTMSSQVSPCRYLLSSARFSSEPYSGRPFIRWLRVHSIQESILSPRLDSYNSGALVASQPASRAVSD